MAIAVGDKLPEATLLRLGEDGPEPVTVSDLTAGRKVVIFGFPGAFTGTCSTAHVPSFMRTRDGFADKGIDEVIGVTVNDPFVIAAFDESTGAGAAGVTLLGDPMSEFVLALDLALTVPAVGFRDRSLRYAMLVEDGVVTVLNIEEQLGECTVSGGEALLESA
ncbi:MAG: peroxiredoxin [Rhodobacteraceae bacterium]|nr:peroxiredoxin [Paracoccaceae bacterium]